MTGSSPPVLARWLLESVIPAPYQQEMVGDLVEEYALRSKSASPSVINRWFWGQVCRSIPALLSSSLLTKDWPGRLGAALGVLVSVGMLKFAAELAIAKVFAPGETARIILAPIVFLTAAAIGGCVTGRYRGSATFFLAFLVMISVCGLIAAHICSTPVPWWYQAVFLVCGPLAVVITPAAIGIHSSHGRRAWPSELQ